MTDYLSRIFIRYPVKTRRALEIFPGFMTWLLILSPLWGSFLAPVVLAYFILFFDVYWFYKSFSLVATATISLRKIKKAEKENWLQKAATLPNFEKINHVLVIPNYKETAEKLRLTLNAIAAQTFPRERIHVVVAMEEREQAAKERSEVLISEYKDKFGSFFVTFHPDVPGEVKGKSSNEAFGGRAAYERLFVKGDLDLDYATVSSVDADSIFDPQYFSYVAHAFLTDKKPYNKFWQSTTVYHNNIWKVPAPTRIISFFGSLWRTSLLVQGDKLITNATYTLSFKLLKEIDFWDVDVIPEDYRIFFKAFFRKKGNIWCEPIFLKTSMDAALSTGYIDSLKNKYHQERRWSWGVSDDPLFMTWWATVPGVPFWRKTQLLYHVVLDHILWPVNWFIITLAANIMPFINPVFSRTSLGYSLPRIAAFILTVCLLAVLAMMVIDFKLRSKEHRVSVWRYIFFPFEFLLMPIVGFFFSSLPALISHTHLMLGKRLEYKVTEKV